MTDEIADKIAKIRALCLKQASNFSVPVALLSGIKWLCDELEKARAGLWPARRPLAMTNQRGWKTLTVYQPWASMIALGHKTIETRSHDRLAWLSGHQIAIHAGKRYQRKGLEYLLDLDFNSIHGLLAESACPRGAVVAVARVDSAEWLSEYHDEAACCPTAGMFGLFLEDIRALKEPIPALGHQGVWEWTPPEGWTVEKDTVPAGNSEFE